MMENLRLNQYMQIADVKAVCYHLRLMDFIAFIFIFDLLPHSGGTDGNPCILIYIFYRLDNGIENA